MIWHPILPTIQNKFSLRELYQDGAQSESLLLFYLGIDSDHYRCTALSSDLDGEGGQHTQELTQLLLSEFHDDGDTLWYTYGIDKSIKACVLCMSMVCTLISNN